MDRKDYFILFGILFFAALIRFWGVHSGHYGISNQLEAAPFFNVLFGGTSETGFWSALRVPNINLGAAAPYINLISGVLGALAMFFVGLEFAGEKKGKNVALFSALFASLAPFLVYYGGVQSWAFLLSSLFLLFAIKIFNTTKKKGAKNAQNWGFLTFFGILAAMVHPTSIIFTLITVITLLVFNDKKAVVEGNLTKLIGVIALLLPVAIFILAKIGNAVFPLISHIAPASGSKILFSLANFFSFYITGASTPALSSLIHNRVTLGVGFFAFVILPLAIAAVCIFKNYVKPKSADFCLGTAALSTFFSILVFCGFSGFAFITNYIVEIYPILILFFAAGLVSFKSKTTKTILAVVFIVVNLFYLTNINTMNLKLVEKSPQKQAIFS